MDEPTIHIGVLYVRLFIGQAQSLKEKRSVIKPLKERIKAKFNVSVAELDGQDKWQVCLLGCALIANDQRFIDSQFSHILSFIDGYHAVNVCDQQVEYY